MTLFELLALVFENLGRRKGRVALTAIGVIIGTAAVVVLVSLGVGLQKNAQEQLGGIGDLTQIQVMPNYGEGPMMVEVAVAGEGGGGTQPPPTQKLITNESLVELASIPGVVSVTPRDWLMAGGQMRFGTLESWASVIGLGLDDLSTMGLTAQQGTTQLGKGQVVIGSMIPTGFYDPRQRPGQEPPPPPELLGQTVSIIMARYTQDGEEIRKVVPLEVVGILAETRGESDWSMYMTIEEVTAYNEWYMGRRISRQRDGYSQATVQVEDVSQVLDIAEQIEGMGYQYFTPQSFVQGINGFFIVLQIIFGGVGAISLLVAAIGIANTMAMAILERTREIGLMKAVGATNRDVLSVFLGEAAGIGFLGGVGGVTLGWSGGQIINVAAMAYLAGQAAQTGGPPPTVAVFTPAWLPLGTLIFATIIGLISGLYPALRAATLVPVVALKYE